MTNTSRRFFLMSASAAAAVALTPWKAEAFTRSSTMPSLAPRLPQFLGGTTLMHGATGASATAVFKPSAMTGAAIQLTIDKAYAAGGGVVQLSAGTYTSDVHLHVKTNVTLAGVGPATVIKAGPTFISAGALLGGYPLITTNGHDSVTIMDLTADQSGELLNGNVEGRLNAYLVEVRNSANVLINGVHAINPFTYSIVVMGSTKFAILNCSTRVSSSGRYDQLDGVHILDSSAGDVLNNNIDQRIGTDGDDGLVAHTIRSAVHDVQFAGNLVRGGNHGNGMQIAVGNFPVYNLTITNNEFYDSPFGIRTGYYDSGVGAVDHVTITGNVIHDLRGGHAFPTGGNAVDVGGFAIDDNRGPVTYVTCTGNRAVSAGNFVVSSGTGNVVSNNSVA